MKRALYAAAAVAAAALTASIVAVSRSGADVGDAAAAALLPALILGVMGFASRYSSAAIPLRRSGVFRVLATHGGAAAAVGAAWVLVWEGWSRVGERTGLIPDPALLFAIAALLYVLTVIVHYLLLEIDATRSAEEAALRYQVLAREAELMAFKAQIDPHFLFNSLNAVAALCGSRPAQAREMAQRMADFFRQTLRVAAQPRITLGTEIDLVSLYLAIEKVRFGERLTIRIDADERARACLVPPLLLQPLVENSVRHGIAALGEGGTVSIEATREGGALRIAIENPVDPDRLPNVGEGIGIRNARERLSAVSDGRATLSARETDGRFRVEVEMPA